MKSSKKLIWIYSILNLVQIQFENIQTFWFWNQILESIQKMEILQPIPPFFFFGPVVHCGLFYFFFISFLNRPSALGPPGHLATDEMVLKANSSINPSTERICLRHGGCSVYFERSWWALKHWIWPLYMDTK